MRAEILGDPMSRALGVTAPELASLEVMGQTFIMMMLSQMLFLPEAERLESIKLCISNWSEIERTYVPSNFVDLIKVEFFWFKSPAKLGL